MRLYVSYIDCNIYGSKEFKIVAGMRLLCRKILGIIGCKKK